MTMHNYREAKMLIETQEEFLRALEARIGQGPVVAMLDALEIAAAHQEADEVNVSALARIGRRLITENMHRKGDASMALCSAGETILKEIGAKMPEGWGE